MLDERAVFPTASQAIGPVISQRPEAAGSLSNVSLTSAAGGGCSARAGNAGDRSAQRARAPAAGRRTNAALTI
jgi:hypothetical protein